MDTQGTRQPFLHDLVTCLRAPLVAISSPDGQLRPGGASGAYDGDTRVLAGMEVRVDGAEPEPLGHSLTGAGRAEFVGVLRRLGDAIADPTVVLVRSRALLPEGMRESLVVRSSAQHQVRCRVTVALTVDLADMSEIKLGATRPPLPAATSAGGLTWRSGARTVAVETYPAPDDTSLDEGTLGWDVVLAPRASAEMTVDVRTSGLRPDGGFRPLATEGPVPWSRPEVTADDQRLVALLGQSLADAEALLVADPDAPEDRFLAAGSPWFLTLFGRDSLWAARMMLPLGTELARGTLAALARRQGRVVHGATEEQPGKILHEARETSLQISEDRRLPALYYGTVDATPLWVCLLADAWRWGMPPEEVEAFLPACEAALQWLVEYGDSDGDGFLEYVDTTGTGLSNQGWKDSGDSIQWSDGRLASAPLALCEVQGYAYQAATAGADLVEAFGRPGSDRWRDWAQRLRRRFRTEFWVEDATGPYPAVALDADKSRVDSLTSNIGHLLGTGLLDDEETRVVARRLADPTMDSGYGLRTLSTESPRFSALSYHGGSVWPHDTAIVLSGLARSGAHREAASLVSGLLGAATRFDYRLPELFGGAQREGEPLLAYPAACHPQAWAATSAVAILQALLGLVPDVPAGRLSVSPLRPAVVGALDVRGLRVAGRELAVRVDREGGLTVDAPPGLDIFPTPDGIRSGGLLRTTT